MDDTMKEDDKKKKKGMAIVIAVTPHAPKKPEDTSKPDEKMEKAWAMMKDSARYRPELDEKIPEKYRRYAPEGAFPAKDVLHDTDIMEHPDWHENMTEDELFELAEKLHSIEGPEEEDDPMEPWMDEPMRKAWLKLRFNLIR